jgi:hypothetical protein
LRTEIFGVLRGIKDGKLTADFGSDEGHLEQKARFDWILAATSSGIEQQRQLEGLLDQRFIDLRWQPGKREEMAYQAARNNPYLENIRAELIVDIMSLLCRAEQEAQTQEWLLSEGDLRWLAKVADIAAVSRASVPHDRQGHVQSLPEPEVGTELAQGFSRIAKGVLCLGLDDWTPYIQRLAWDCMPSIRVELLRCLQKGPQTVNQLEQTTCLSQRTIYYHIEELEMPKVVKNNNGTIGLIISLP